MTAEVSARSGVCLEYQRLLSSCQKSLASWQQQTALIARHAPVGHQAAAELKRLRNQYTRAYAALEDHEHVCPNCQFVSKISGLDFECMSSALDSYRRP
jgi:hypothetical protein